MLHAEVDKNLWSEHSVEASLFPLSSCNQAWLRNSCATHGSCNRRSLAANRGEWGSYVTVCWDHPLRIVEKNHAKGKIISFSRPVFFLMKHKLKSWPIQRTRTAGNLKQVYCTSRLRRNCLVWTWRWIVRRPIQSHHRPLARCYRSVETTCGNHFFFVFKGWGIIFQQVD